MNWRSDPPNLWTGLYRLAMMAMMTYLVAAHSHAGNIPSPIDAIRALVGFPP